MSAHALREPDERGGGTSPPIDTPPSGLGGPIASTTTGGVPQGDPEAELARLRQLELERGGQLLEEGTEAIRGFDPEDFFGPEALRSQFEQATTTSFLPQLRGLQARSSRRGIRGPLAGALEGDLTTAFRRDLLAEVGRSRGLAAEFTLRRGGAIADIGGTRRAQGISLLGTELEIRLAREQAKKEEDAAKRRGFGALLFTIAGCAIGGAKGGVEGAAIGCLIGSKIGDAA